GLRAVDVGVGGGVDHDVGAMRRDGLARVFKPRSIQSRMRERDDFMSGQNRLQRAPELPAGACDQYFHSSLRKSLGLSCNRTYRTYRTHGSHESYTSYKSYKSYSFLFKPRQDVHQLPQRFRRNIFLRQDRGMDLFERPIDLQVGVVPHHADLA